MPARITLRELTPDERTELQRLASARTAPARLVERARIVLGAAEGEPVGVIAGEANVSRPTVSAWVRRFNDGGLAALEDRPRSGRPHTYDAGQRAAVVAAALTDPKDLGLPFGCWTLDRLQVYLSEQKGIPIKRSRIDELLRAEGLRWRHQETWFGERVDPAFAEKRGSSSGSTPPRRRAPSWSASTRWGRSRPGATPANDPSAPRRRPMATAAAAPPGGLGRRPTTAAAARATSSGPSARRPAGR
jgi:transposase